MQKYRKMAEVIFIVIMHMLNWVNSFNLQCEIFKQGDKTILNPNARRKSGFGLFC